MGKLNNKIILITGGVNGIGEATAIKFCKNNKVFVIDNDAKNCERLKNQYPEINVYNEDITRYEQINLIVDSIINNYGNINILINNAAIQNVCNIMNLKLSDWEMVLNVNLTATFYITQYVANRMKKNSTILNIISTHYNKPRIDKLHYDVSKAGVAMLTEGFALELAKKEITVNAIAIGATYTSMNKCFENKEILEEAKNKIPMHYIASADDIANHIFNFICYYSDSTTGSIYIVDGGRHLI